MKLELKIPFPKTDKTIRKTEEKQTILTTINFDRLAFVFYTDLLIRLFDRSNIFVAHSFLNPISNKNKVIFDFVLYVELWILLILDNDSEN